MSEIDRFRRYDTAGHNPVSVTAASAIYPVVLSYAVFLGLIVHVYLLLRPLLQTCTNDQTVYIRFHISESRREAFGVTGEHGGFPNVVQATEEHHYTLHPDPQAAMWWSSILKAVDVGLDAFQGDLMGFGPLCGGTANHQYSTIQAIRSLLCVSAFALKTGQQHPVPTGELIQ